MMWSSPWTFYGIIGNQRNFEESMPHFINIMPNGARPSAGTLMIKSWSIKVRIKCLAFCIQHFQVHFLEREKMLIVIKDIVDACSEGLNDNKSGNARGSNRQQTKLEAWEISVWGLYVFVNFFLYGLVQDCSNSITNVLELLQSCTKPSIWSLICDGVANMIWCFSHVRGRRIRVSWLQLHTQITSLWRDQSLPRCLRWTHVW